MALGAERGGDAARGGELAAGARVIVDRQRAPALAGRTRAGGGDHRVEPPGDEDDGGGISHRGALGATLLSRNEKKGRGEAARKVIKGEKRADQEHGPLCTHGDCDRVNAHATSRSAGTWNTCAQKAQSTWISPAASAISRRSSSENFARTPVI